MSFFNPQNPGIGGLDELTDSEALFLQNLRNLSYAQGDILYYNGTDLTRLAIGTAGQILTVNAGATAPSWATGGGGGGGGATTALDNLASVAINTSLLPGTNDGAALGSLTKNFSDLFLASGAVINFNNSDVTVTHSADTLTFSGGTIVLGTATSSGLTMGGTLVMGTNSITMTGSIAATGARVLKGWFTDVESTNMYTVGGTSLSSTFSPIAGSASITTLGTIGTGTWQGSVISSTYGGTGINNGGRTLTLNTNSGTIAFSAASKTLTIAKTLTLDGTDSTTMTFPSTSATIARIDAAQTFTGSQTFSNAVIHTNNAITASANAATVPVTARLNTVTNNSAATLTITMATASAVDGQMTIVRVLDFSAVAQTITWVNTENSTVSAPVTSNGSTTLFLTVGFIYNNATSKWRCIASA